MAVDSDADEVEPTDDEPDAEPALWFNSEEPSCIMYCRMSLGWTVDIIEGGLMPNGIECGNDALL